MGHAVIACNTCRHWDRRYPENQGLGVCRKMGVLLFGPDAAIVLSGDRIQNEEDYAPATDVAAVRTMDDFACIGHTPHGSSLTLRDRLPGLPVALDLTIEP